MRIIPVVDLMNGRVVRGVAGRRDEYRPVESRIAADARPGTIARAFVEQFGFDTIYVADIDAIMSPLDENEYWMECWEAIGQAGAAIWLDAGIRHAADARRLRQTIEPLSLDVHYVVGLESLTNMGELGPIAAEVGRERTIFSLDLKGGRPIKPILPRLEEPLQLAYRVAAHGVSRLIVLDLADVGMASGAATLPLCAAIRQELGAAVELIAGGGVRGLADLQAMADAGCDAALVASALHDGKLAAADVRAAEEIRSRWSKPTEQAGGRPKPSGIA